MQVSLAGVDVAAAVPGAVVCHPEWPLRLAARLEARVVVLDVAVPILRGQQARGRVKNLSGFSVVRISELRVVVVDVAVPIFRSRLSGAMVTEFGGCNDVSWHKRVWWC